ncbi:ABC transporter ATP-binding protein [bacterium]|nr:ABC transporter ATP-binding protein [bacterium]
MALISLEYVTKVYHNTNERVTALQDLTLEVERSEFLVVKGASGSGKSTLLLIMGGMLRPTRGRVIIDGSELYRLPPRARTAFRANQIGFIFQMFHLIPYLTVRENILTGTGALGTPDEGMLMEAVRAVDMEKRIHNFPNELSTGEMQRAALARALSKKPKIILADEPTGNLDEKNAARIFTCLKEYTKQGGTAVVVTHGPDADDYSDRIISLD